MSEHGFTIENLDFVLSHASIDNQPSPSPAEYFERSRYFKISGCVFHIDWWVNVPYLTTPNGVVVPFCSVKFCSVKVSNTWPNGSKLNLQFYNQHGDVCCILPIEQYTPEES